MRYLPWICTLLLTGACLGTSAQEGHGAGATPVTTPRGPDAAPLSKGEIKAMRDFQLLDFNGDGKISRNEVVLFPRLAAAFSDGDTNHDNYLSYEEVRAYAVRYRAERDRQRAAQTPDGNTAETRQGTEKKP